VFNLHGNNNCPMKIAYKHSGAILLTLALANWLSPFQSRCRGAEQPPVNLAERLRVLGAEDHGLRPIAQARQFSSIIFTEASSAGLLVLSCSKVTSQTNGSFIELQQTLAVESTEQHLLNFLGNVAASNSALRVQSLALHPTPDRSRLAANIAIAGHYRLPPEGQSSDPDAARMEYLVLSQRQHLRQAALDCYNVAKATLPPGWNLESLNFQDGKRLSAQGMAPGDQVHLLPDVRARFEQAQSQNGRDLFLPSTGEATMRMTEPGLTNFCWSMQFDLRPPESPEAVSSMR
jgi:hypothetical protein